MPRWSGPWSKQHAGLLASVPSDGLALELLVEDGECRGVLAAPPAGRSGRRSERGNVVLATGGVGQLFAVTTNPSEATGDGVAMALRAGVPVTDAEFVQFHPTALHHPAMLCPLLSEALRGSRAHPSRCQGRALRGRARLPRRG